MPKNKPRHSAQFSQEPQCPLTLSSVINDQTLRQTLVEYKQRLARFCEQFRRGVLPRPSKCEHLFELYRQLVDLGGKAPLLCQVCSKTLDGRKKRYCSDQCRGIAKSRRWRRDHPEDKMKADLRYLRDVLPQERKRKQ